MKRSRLTDEQIVRVLQEADRNPIAAVAKQHGVSEASIYVWRKRFGAMGTVKSLRSEGLKLIIQATSLACLLNGAHRPKGNQSS